MITLSEVQKDAGNLAAELMRTLYHPQVVPPTIDELADFCCSVETCEADDCTECSRIGDAAHNFGDAVKGYQEADGKACGELLAKLLAAIDYGENHEGRNAVRSSREMVDEFVDKLPKAQAEVDIRSMTIDRSQQEKGNTIFIPLPRALWRESMVGQCRCPQCAEVPGRVCYWDTLALAADLHSKSPTWTVHRPDRHPDRLRGEEVSI